MIKVLIPVVTVVGVAIAVYLSDRSDRKGGKK